MSVNNNNNNNKFFQHEKKFIFGKAYETLLVKTPPYGKHNYNLETCDEIGNIVPNTEKFLGYYQSSAHVGYGDGGTRYDYFTNKKGEIVMNYLNYEGTTRYRKVNTEIEVRLPYLTLYESVGNNINEGGKNEHINRYILNPDICKEICSFMNPNI